MITGKSMILMACVLASMGLGACGVKPSSLQPPPDAEKSNFPGVYPAVIKAGTQSETEIKIKNKVEPIQEPAPTPEPTIDHRRMTGY